MQWSSLGRTCVCVVAVRWNVTWYSSCLSLLQTSLFSSLRMRFLLFSISLLHIHISRLPVFLTVLISCCIFGRPSKRTLMMLQVSHLLSVAKPEAALSLWVNIHSSSSLRSESTVRQLAFQSSNESGSWLESLLWKTVCLLLPDEQSIVFGKCSSGRQVRKA